GTGGGRGPWKLERLVYGTTYQIAVFYFGNAGNIPAELIEAGGTPAARPWSFVLPPPSTALPVIRHEYLRRCPIGSVRFSPGPAFEAFPPSVPERVYPLTRALRGGDQPASTRSTLDTSG